MTRPSIFDRLRSMQTEGLPLHTLIVEACEVGNALIRELDIRISDLTMLRRAIEEGDPRGELFVRIDDMKRESAAALLRAFPRDGDTPTNGARAA